MKRLQQFARSLITIGVASCVLVCALGSGQAEAHPDGSSQSSIDQHARYVDEPLDASQSMLPASDLSLSLLSFAVGVGACLIVVRALFPTLVRAHCAEIVRDYLDRAERDSGMKVLVIDRDSNSRTQVVGSHDLPTTAAGRSVRVDEAATAPVQPKRAAPAKRDATQSMLGSIYQENLDLQSKLRSQNTTHHP